MNVGIIGCGSMGGMILRRMLDTGKVCGNNLYVSNRTYEKIAPLSDVCSVCRTNPDLAAASDIIFLCVKPQDIRPLLEEIRGAVREDALVVSLNANILLESLQESYRGKLAKVVPSLTAETGRSQTLVCFCETVPAEDRAALTDLLSCLGDVYELKEEEMGMGSELVSCMPGFIASIFDVICASAGRHIPFREEQIKQMVTRTFDATGDLMIKKGMDFNEIVTRVATPGGITQEGTKVIYERFPEIADEMFEVTLAKRKQIAQRR